MSNSIPTSTDEIRRAYIDFFVGKQHVHHPSASLVPENDPTILFTVAGMAQFKDMFLGRGSLPFKEAVTCQKCIRTNDIMQVGQTARHHTFFEMLGNFSFNAYFKREAISHAWEFLTQVLQLDQTRLSISVHDIDDDAYAIWRDEIGVPEERIFRMGDDDNFWPASAPSEGPLGPGGCCSEIFWDFQTNDDAEDNLTKDTGRFVEIWNLVFPQYNVCEPKVDGRYTLDDLGRQNIDTGMGLERLACVMQGKFNNFDTDVLAQIVAAVSSVSGVAYQEGATLENSSAQQCANNTLLRRVADHVRAVSFCISDGALPGNTGRNYIVRRLIRRATLDIDKLGVQEVSLYKIVDAVIRTMGEAYPELKRRQDLIVKTFESEEKNFRGTLRKGLELLERTLKQHKADNAKKFSGDDAFELFTTHGFPKELTAELVEQEGLVIDEERYAERWEAFVAVSNSKSIDVFEQSALQDAKPELGATDFNGYHDLSSDVNVVFIEEAGEKKESVAAGAKVRFALDKTPFYAEGGGQIGDQGVIETDDYQVRVDDTQKDEGLFIHSGEVVSGNFVLGAARATVAAERRAQITAHHSATHLLHSALYTHLGDHIEQQGSQVEAGQLRFDYNNPQAPSAEQLRAVEDQVNAAITAAHEVKTEELAIDDARQAGAKAQFGEKYGDTVRVVTMGSRDVSIELCGGCHVQNTRDIGQFKIIKDEASSAGIRRIIAVAGAAAAAVIAEEQRLASAVVEVIGGETADVDIPAIQQLLKVTGDELITRIEHMSAQLAELRSSLGLELWCGKGTALERIKSIQAAIKEAQRQLQDQQAKEALENVSQLFDQAEQIGQVKVLAQQINVDVKALRQAAEALVQRDESAVICLAAAAGEKVMLIIACGPDAQSAGLAAGKLVGEIAPIVGGRGGGKPAMAQAGGRDIEKIPEALAAVAGVVKATLGVGAG